MSRTIIVDPVKLESAARLIEQQVADYERQYKQLFSEVDGMGSAWQGADNIAFVTQIKGFMDDFQLMVGSMREYAEFLKLSAQKYKATQEDVISNARRLTN